MKKLTFIILSIATVLISACNGGINRESVVGKWKVVDVYVDINKGIDTNTLEHKANVDKTKKSLLEEVFILNADSSYSIIENKTKTEFKGTWKFDEEIKAIDFIQTGDDEPSFIWNVKSVNNSEMKIKAKFRFEFGNTVSLFVTLNKE